MVLPEIHGAHVTATWGGITDSLSELSFTLTHAGETGGGNEPLTKRGGVARQETHSYTRFLALSLGFSSPSLRPRRATVRCLSNTRHGGEDVNKMGGLDIHTTPPHGHRCTGI